MNTFMKERQKRPVNRLYLIGFVLVLLVLFVVLIYWGKQRGKYGGLDDQEVEMLVPQIKEISLEPAIVYSVDSVRSIPVLKKSLNHVKYQFKWYVNGDVVADVGINLLENKYFRRGDKVYCEVLASTGQYQSDWVASPSIKISNSKPTIQLTSIDPFQVPGRFSYQINASDADGDILSYRLVAPLNRGITINEQTGLIEWQIPGFTPDESTENVVGIIFEVSDSEGETATGSISLNLTSGKQEAA